jgi:hypothetical protein
MYTPMTDSDVDRERKKLAKIVRANVRLHFGLMADDHINAVLGPILDDHTEAVVEGAEYVFDWADLHLPEEV